MLILPLRARIGVQSRLFPRSSSLKEMDVSYYLF